MRLFFAVMLYCSISVPPALPQYTPAGAAFQVSGGGGGSSPLFISGAISSTGGTDCSMVLSVTSGYSLLVHGWSTSLPGTLSITAGGTATAIGSQYDDTIPATTAWMWTIPVASTNAALTITVHDTSSANALFCGVEQFDRAITVDQVATPATVAAASATWTSGTTSITTQANETIVGMFGVEQANGADFTPGSGFTFGPSIPTTTSNISVLEYRTVSATGTYSCSATLNSGVGVTGGAAFCVTLKGP